MKVVHFSDPQQDFDVVVSYGKLKIIYRDKTKTETEISITTNDKVEDITKHIIDDFKKRKIAAHKINIVENALIQAGFKKTPTHKVEFGVEKISHKQIPNKKK